MILSDIARLRLCNQQLLRPSLTTPAEVVRWFGAVQSQDLASSVFAIGLRMRDASEALVERSIADRSIVRSWPMRRTIHCMPAEDARWMIRMLAPRQIARMAPYHRRMGIDDKDLKRAGKVIHSALTRERQLARSELYRKLNTAGIATDGPANQMRGMHILVHWAQAGLICIAPRRAKQQMFGLLEEWTPAGRNLSGDEALAELAKRYFQSHGPATVKDFAWWAGLKMIEAKRALQSIAGLLHSVRLGQNEYWLMRDAPGAGARATPVLLLPAFDEYTVAYADRSVAADKAVLASVNHGLSANIVIDGRIAGTWKRTLSGSGGVVVTSDLLRSLSSKERIGLTKAVERYAEFLGRTPSSGQQRQK
jgi:hypothetical protein